MQETHADTKNHCLVTVNNFPVQIPVALKYKAYDLTIGHPILLAKQFIRNQKQFFPSAFIQNLTKYRQIATLILLPKINLLNLQFFKNLSI
jgi:hypothetical protein